MLLREKTRPVKKYIWLESWKRLFDWKTRSGRREFLWVSALNLFIYSFLLGGVVLVYALSGRRLNFSGFLLLFPKLDDVVWILTAISYAALTARRLNDIGFPVWIKHFWAAFLVLTAISNPWRTPVFDLVIIPVMAVFFIIAVFKKGSSEENRYGVPVAEPAKSITALSILAILVGEYMILLRIMADGGCDVFTSWAHYNLPFLKFSFCHVSSIKGDVFY